MTITLNLPPDIERTILAEAATRGLSLNDFVSGMLVSQAHIQTPSAHVGAPSVPMEQDNDMAPADPEEWIQEFRAWAKGHEQDELPLLSDEAISREFIYRECGL